MSGGVPLVHADPQSCWKVPTPRTPFAPSAWRLLSFFMPVQELGTVGIVGSPINWMGRPATVAFKGVEAVSPAIWMVASDTDPQVKPSTNWLHCAMTLPFAVCWGSGTSAGSSSPPAALARIRTPTEPVSTKTWSMGWHVEVPGTQTVIVANAPLAYAGVKPAGPPSTTIGNELLTPLTTVTLTGAVLVGSCCEVAVIV